MNNRIRHKILYIIAIAFIFVLTACGEADLKDESASMDSSTFEVASTDNAFRSDSDLSSEASDEYQQDIEEIPYTEPRITTLPDPQIVSSDDSVTMMVYMVGSDLESKGGAATADINEMLSSGFDFTKNNLLIYTGGSTKWYSDISEEDNCIFQLTDEGLSLLQKYPSDSMGNPDCLSTFLNYAYKNFKSDSFNLILWDHGNGPVMGYGKDKLYDGDSLTLPEIKSALNKSPFNSDNRLGFVGFDACLMSSAELSCTLSEYADYLVASQEVEPNFGWNYAFLKDCGKVSSKSLAELAAYNYVKYCDEYFDKHENFRSDVTMACIDLSCAKDLEEAINSLFDKAIDDVSGNYNSLAKERYNTRALGRSTTGSEYDLVDLKSLMTHMSERYGEQAKSVQSILDRMIFYSANNTADCNGISLYYPYFNKKFYSGSWKESYSELDTFSSYQAYLNRYEQVWLGTDMRESFSTSMTPEEYTPGSYTLSLNEKQQECYLASGFYIMKKYGEGIFSPISYSRDVSYEDGIITANYDGKTIMASDDYGNKIPVGSVLADKIGDYYYYTINHAVKDHFYEYYYDDYYNMHYPAETQLMVNQNTSEVKICGTYLLDEDDNKADSISTGKKVPLDPGKYMVYNLSVNMPCYPVRDSNDILLPYNQWQSSGKQFSSYLSQENGLKFTYEPYYDDGYEYFIMFDVIDTQDNHYSSELMPITLAKAPEEVYTPPTITEVDWTDGLLSPTISKSGLDIQFYEAKLPNITTPYYGLYVANNNDTRVILRLSNIIVNDIYEDWHFYSFDIPSDSSYSLKFSTISDLLRYSGFENPSSIQFTCTISDFISGKILMNDEVIKYNISSNIAPQVISLPSLDTDIPQQTLFEDDTVKIDLVECGKYLVPRFQYDSLRLEGRLKIHAKVADIPDIRLSGLEINGFYYDRINIEYSPNQLTDSDQYVYFNCPLDGYAVNELSSINFVFLMKYSYLTTTSMKKIFPVNFDAATPQNIDYSKLDCVYEDEYIKIYDLGTTYDYSKSDYPLNRAIIVVNKSDNYLKLNDDTYENKLSPQRMAPKVFYDRVLPANTSMVALIGCGSDSSWANIIMSLNISVYNFGKDDNEIGNIYYYNNDVITYITPKFELKELE